MGKSLSLDIRDRVVLLVDEGLSCQEARDGCAYRRRALSGSFSASSGLAA